MSRFQFENINERNNQIVYQQNDRQQQHLSPQYQRHTSQQINNSSNPLSYNQNSSAKANLQNKQNENNRSPIQPIFEQNSFQHSLISEDLKYGELNYSNPKSKEIQKNNISYNSPIQTALTSHQQYHQSTQGGSGGNSLPTHNQQTTSNNTLNPTVPLLSDREQQASTEEAFNYCTQANGARIMECTSYTSKCHPQNLLNNVRNSIWMSDEGLPQSIVIDLTDLQERPRFFKCIGFDCWHDYSTNPAVIEISVSTDGFNFITWVTLRAELKAGIQLFSIDHLGKRYNFIKLTIKETHGASKVYMNSLYLLEDNPLVKFNKLSNYTLQSVQQQQQLQQQQQTEVISPTNKNIVFSHQNNNSKDLLQIHTSPIQHIDIQTQCSPQNMTLLNSFQQQNNHLIDRRSPSHNQHHPHNQHPQYLPQQQQQQQLQKQQQQINHFHSQSPTNFANIQPLENESESYTEVYNSQIRLQQQLYQQDMMAQQQQHLSNLYYQQQHQLPIQHAINNQLPVQHAINNQSKLQHNLSGVDEDYRAMSGSMVNAPHPHPHHRSQDYLRQNIMEDARSIFFDQNNNSLNQVYPSYQIVDNLYSSPYKSHSNNSKNIINQNQVDFSKYVPPYDQKFEINGSTSSPSQPQWLNDFNNVLDKKLLNLEASLSRVLMKSLLSIQQNQPSLGDRLSLFKDSHKEISGINQLSAKSSLSYQKGNASSQKNYQTASLRESQLNGQYHVATNDLQQQIGINSNGFNKQKRPKEVDTLSQKQTFRHIPNSDHILRKELLPHKDHIPQREHILQKGHFDFPIESLSTSGQDIKKTRLIQLLDKLQIKLAERVIYIDKINFNFFIYFDFMFIIINKQNQLIILNQLNIFKNKKQKQNKIDQLNEKEKRLKAKYKEQRRDTSQKNETLETQKQRKNNRNKLTPQKQLFSDTSDT